MSAMHVRVRAGGEQYALPVAGVREIATLGTITPVPGAPAEVLGIWNLRGDVIAAIDLGAVLGLEPAAESSRIVVAEDGELHAGLVVEAVVDVAPLPEALEPADSEYLSAMVLIDRIPVGVIDLGTVLGAVSVGAAW
jgi:purine-binding chemotaxis protein CheW